MLTRPAIHRERLPIRPPLLPSARSARALHTRHTMESSNVPVVDLGLPNPQIDNSEILHYNFLSLRAEVGRSVPRPWTLYSLLHDLQERSRDGSTVHDPSHASQSQQPDEPDSSPDLI